MSILSLKRWQPAGPADAWKFREEHEISDGKLIYRRFAYRSHPVTFRSQEGFLSFYRLMKRAGGGVATITLRDGVTVTDDEIADLANDEITEIYIATPEGARKFTALITCQPQMASLGGFPAYVEISGGEPAGATTDGVTVTKLKECIDRTTDPVPERDLGTRFPVFNRAAELDIAQQHRETRIRIVIAVVSVFGGYVLRILTGG